MSPHGGPLQYWRAGYSAPRLWVRQRYSRRKRSGFASLLAALDITTSASTTATTSMSTSASTTRSTTTATVPPPEPPFDFDDDLAEPVVGGSSERAREVFLRMLRVNNAGDYGENPVLEGVKFTAILHKHNADEEFLKVWVTTEADGVVVDATARATETDEEVSVTLVAGEDLVAGFPAILNTLHFTTSYGHIKGGLYCATQPRAMVLLDGYNADDEDRPAILRISE